MTTEEKLALLAEVFDVTEDTLDLEKNLEEISEYDSMTKLSLIVMMEDEFGVKLNGEDIKKFVKVKDIIELMK